MKVIYQNYKIEIVIITDFCYNKNIENSKIMYAVCCMHTGGVLITPSFSLSHKSILD